MKATRTDHPFWTRIRIVDDADSCWEWTGYRDRRGRAKMTFEGRNQYVYRIAWQLAEGPIPEGMYICHHCDNPPCCRPDHLFVGTHRDNMIDGLMKGIVTLPTNLPRGATHHDAKASDEQVAEARELYASGTSGTVLMRKYGVTSSVINSWVRGKTRRDAGGPISPPRINRASR